MNEEKKLLTPTEVLHLLGISYSRSDNLIVQK
jgi:hypothetical protein